MDVTPSGRARLRLDGAKPYDAGVYKCVARNCHGAAVCYARLWLGQRPGPPLEPGLLQAADTALLLQWEVPKHRSGHATTLGYTLQRQAQNDADWTTIAEDFGHQFFVVRNLQPSTVYQFRVKARNKFGWSEYSAPSEAMATLEPGAPKIRITKAQKYHQEMTERGMAEPVTDEPEGEELDYSREARPFTELEQRDPLEAFSMSAQMSRGRCGAVVQAYSKQSEAGTVVAKFALHSRQEAATLYKLCHERVVTLLDAFVYRDFAVLVMEKLSGLDVMAYLTASNQYSEETVALIIQQVLDALEYIHYRGFCYLDLQPDNVVMTDGRSSNVKLVDFGAARAVPPAGSPVDWSPADCSLEFVAPEVLQRQSVSAPADVWTAGVLAYILLSGVSPFRGHDAEATRKNVTMVQWQFENLFPEVTVEASRFLMLIFKRCPLKRPNIEECLENKWLSRSEFMLHRRENALLDAAPLRKFAIEFRKTKDTEVCQKLMDGFGVSLTTPSFLEGDEMEEM